MFRVLTYDADGFGWSCVFSHGNSELARAVAFLVKKERAFQWFALVQVRYPDPDGPVEITIVESNAPNADRLIEVEAFRTAATCSTAEVAVSGK
jgi:hypothetical protein